jgi:hypothetical protein
MVERTHDSFGSHEMRTVSMVEVGDTLPGEFKVLTLIFSHGNVSCSAQSLAINS